MGAKVKKILVLGLAASLGVCSAGATDQTTANVSVDSEYYSYIDKLSGMGYIESLPNGAKPYSRMQMARWVVEAEDKAVEKPMPAYLADELQALENYLAPEIETIKGNPTQDNFRLRSVKAELDYQKADQFDHRYGNVAGSWAPFSRNHNGHKYGRDGNVSATVDLSGNIGHETAVSIKGRGAYDRDNNGKFDLEEAYIKTRAGSLSFEAGRQAMIWGQGESGHLLLGNNMKPLTAIQMHLANPVKVGGFFKFLGEVDFHSFYGWLDRDRADDARSRGVHDYNNPGLLGLRLDITPAKWFTFGASRISMLGGNHNGLDHTDWKHWMTGRNDDGAHDKWDDIGGFDFRFRFPGIQLYGEMMGEDAAGGMPSDWGYRGGVYIPRLTHDGSWDLTLEMAKTNEDWYVHQTYQDGWTYSGDIMGDAMGNDARTYYARLNHYLPGEKKIGLYYLRTEFQRNQANHPTVDEIGLTGQMNLGANRFLNGTIGYANIDGRYDDNPYFAGVSLEWRM